MTRPNDEQAKHKAAMKATFLIVALVAVYFSAFIIWWGHPAMGIIVALLAILFMGSIGTLLFAVYCGVRELLE